MCMFADATLPLAGTTTCPVGSPKQTRWDATLPLAGTTTCCRRCGSHSKRVMQPYPSRGLQPGGKRGQCKGADDATLPLAGTTTKALERLLTNIQDATLPLAGTTTFPGHSRSQHPVPMQPYPSRGLQLCKAEHEAGCCMMQPYPSRGLQRFVKQKDHWKTDDATLPLAGTATPRAPTT